MGLSPHVRGNRSDLGVQAGHTRSIPACTGKPLGDGGAHHAQRVYPRMYGETEPAPYRLTCQTGLSPHVRGNRARGGGPARGERSIPACTGKPRGVADRRSHVEVYPRMYGETSARRCSRSTFTVYPRMYGETNQPVRGRPPVPGLSPHVRGNPAPNGHPPDSPRSIPACTGKPTVYCDGPPRAMVYPRMYGETSTSTAPRSTSTGLSPHVRGNRETVRCCG